MWISPTVPLSLLVPDPTPIAYTSPHCEIYLSLLHSPLHLMFSLSLSVFLSFVHRSHFFRLLAETNWSRSGSHMCAKRKLLRNVNFFYLIPFLFSRFLLKIRQHAVALLPVMQLSTLIRDTKGIMSWENNRIRRLSYICQVSHYT